MTDGTTFTHDPQAVLDYKVDWSGWLAEGETISTSSWTVTGPDEVLTIGTDDQAPSHDTTSATVWLLGGTLGKSYKAVNHVVTSQGRADDRSLTIVVRDR